MRSRRGLVLILSLAAADAGAQEITATLSPQEIVPRGATWRYLRGLAEPGGETWSWTHPDFADSTWEVGRAGFGYSDGDDATLLADMTGAYSTVYLRRVFEVDDPAAVEGLRLLVDYDDGFIALLNGREIARANAGARDSYPGRQGLATDSHEAGEPEAFLVPDPAAVLLRGRNVLAVMGLNRALENADFSIHPWLEAGGALAEGCPGELYLAGSRALLEGLAPVPAAAQVRVNGVFAALDTATGEWSQALTVLQGSVDVAIEALDASGSTVASRTIRAIRASAVAGGIDAETILRASGSPHLVTGPVRVGPDGVLRVEAGAQVLLLPGVVITVEGEVQAIGSAEAPIRFAGLPCQAPWGQFRFPDSLGVNTFRHCELSGAAGETGNPACLNLTDSFLELDGCTIRDIDGEGVHATGCTTRIRRCLIERTNEALSLDRGDTVVEFCTVRNSVGKSDLIDANGPNDPPARIAFNHIYGTSDDGIDADNGAVHAEGNIIHDCGDQAISLVGEGSSTVVRNVCFRNGNGLSVKDSHVVAASWNTFVLNTVTGARAIEKTPGRGGGRIALRSSIVWGNVAQLVVEADGVIDVTHCDVEGGPPAGAGNISLDPLFLDPAADDFRLGEGSPCIGAAEDGSDLGALPSELILPAPAGLAVSVSGPASLTLDWTDRSLTEQGFELERAEEAAGFGFLALLPADAVTYTDRDLRPGVYRYRLRAFSPAGASPYVGPVEGRIEPPAPEVISIEPAEGPSRGGFEVTIRGKGFDLPLTAFLGEAPLLPLDLLGPTELRALVPAGRRGRVDLTVTTAGGTAALPGAFAYHDVHPRGDASGDGARDLADVIALLEFLYREGPPAPCDDVADANTDGGVDLSDAVFLLFFLFEAGVAPGPDQAICR